MNVKCKYFGECGGCDLLNQTYQNQLDAKTLYVKQMFKNSKIFAPIHNTIGMKNPFCYRNKVHLAFEETRGKINIGFYKKNSKEVINIESCVMHESWLKVLIDIIKQFIEDFKISIYNARQKRGILRYVVARSINNSIIVTLVVANTKFSCKEVLYSRLNEKFDSVSLYLNINNRSDNAVFDKKFVFVKGERGLNVDFMDVKFSLSPSSFMQVNLNIAESIYKTAIDSILNKKVDIILDLFSGIGITSLIFAKNGASVISIESEKSSVNDAIRLQKKNDLTSKITALCGPCENLIAEVCQSINHKTISVFLDPPRSGVMPVVFNELLQNKPKQIIYLSCNCETLVRDLKIILKNSNYQIDFVKPFDMFPHTNHVEILTSLTIKND